MESDQLEREHHDEGNVQEEVEDEEGENESFFTVASEEEAINAEKEAADHLKAGKYSAAVDLLSGVLDFRYIT